MKKLFTFLTVLLILSSQAYAVNYYRQPQSQGNYIVVPRGTRVVPANPYNYNTQNNRYYNQNTYNNDPYAYNNNQNYNYRYDRRNRYYSNQNNTNYSNSTGAEVARTIIDALK